MAILPYSARKVDGVLTSGSHKGNHVAFNIEEFPSANVLLEVCESRTYREGEGFSHDSLNRKDKDWSGATGAEAKAFIKQGWKGAQLDQVKHELTKIEETTPIVKRSKSINAVEGYMPNVARMLMGLPDSMINIQQKAVKGKVVSLYYDMTCNCGIDSNDLIKAGIKVMKKVAELERNGYRVRLESMVTFFDGSSADVCAVKVKSEDQPLDLQRMMFPFMHTGMFRVMDFAWYERCPTTKYRSGYGHSINYSYNDTDSTAFAKQMFGDSAVYVSAVSVLPDNGDNYLNSLFGTKTAVQP